MSCEYTCDGCGKKAPAKFYATNPLYWFHPSEWFQRGDKDGIQDACSRECAIKASQEKGKTTVVIPC